METSPLTQNCNIYSLRKKKAPGGREEGEGEKALNFWGEGISQGSSLSPRKKQQPSIQHQHYSIRDYTSNSQHQHFRSMYMYTHVLIVIHVIIHSHTFVYTSHTHTTTTQAHTLSVGSSMSSGPAEVRLRFGYRLVYNLQLSLSHQEWQLVPIALRTTPGIRQVPAIPVRTYHT